MRGCNYRAVKESNKNHTLECDDHAIFSKSPLAVCSFRQLFPGLSGVFSHPVCQFAVPDIVSGNTAISR